MENIVLSLTEDEVNDLCIALLRGANDLARFIIEQADDVPAEARKLNAADHIRLVKLHIKLMDAMAGSQPENEQEAIEPKPNNS